MTNQQPIGGSAMSVTWPWVPSVALITALTILFSAFVFPPVKAPGVSISKASSAGTETAAAEHTGRDAEEDGGGENEFDDLVVANPTAITSAPSPLACRRGRPSADAAWPAAGRPHGPDSVRGPPA
ncbi:MAG: hypothetical protein RLZZ21_1054 [Planctomycetota bacterium]|jgi:hypothetical protein